jgi:light-regulated signal transduction histidine kinase (bacteriophytochrome)
MKHILARHEAELEIKSSYGEGSSFICRLPLSRAEERECDV